MRYSLSEFQTPDGSKRLNSGIDPNSKWDAISKHRLSKRNNAKKEERSVLGKRGHKDEI